MIVIYIFLNMAQHQRDRPPKKRSYYQKCEKTITPIRKVIYEFKSHDAKINTGRCVR